MQRRMHSLLGAVNPCVCHGDTEPLNPQHCDFQRTGQRPPVIVSDVKPSREKSQPEAVAQSRGDLDTQKDS